MSPSFDLDKLKSTLKKYGRTGVAVYLCVSTCVTTGCYIAIKNHVDVKGLLGIKDDPDKEPSYIEKLIFGSGSHVALAILCSKAFIPLKLPVSVALTPYVHRTVQGLMRNARKSWD